MPVLAACFLFFCPHHVTHKRHVVHPVEQKAPEVDTAKTARHDGNRSCDFIVKGYSGQNRDNYVSSFAVGQQHHVLECLERGLAK